MSAYEETTETSQRVSIIIISQTGHIRSSSTLLNNRKITLKTIHIKESDRILKKFDSFLMKGYYMQSYVLWVGVRMRRDRNRGIKGP